MEEEIASSEIENELIKLTTNSHASKSAAESGSIHSSMMSRAGPPLQASIKSEGGAAGAAISVKSGEGARLPIGAESAPLKSGSDRPSAFGGMNHSAQTRGSTLPASMPGSLVKNDRQMLPSTHLGFPPASPMVG